MPALKWLRYLITGLMLLRGAAHGGELKDFAGTWVMKVGGRNLFVLTLTAQGDWLIGAWDRPMTFTGSNGAYANMRGGIGHEAVVMSRLASGVLHFRVQNAADGTEENAFAMIVYGEHATLSFDRAPPNVVTNPYLLERAAAGATVAIDWQPNRLYTRTDFDVPSADMKAIYTEDQSKTDAERRKQTRKLIEAGALHTGKDYEEAAVVFQHGDAPDDYLLAHTLATIAVAKGDATAIWICAATMDRYLEKIGQKQIFGTQFSSDAQHHWTLEPYDRNLVPDILRPQLAVPTQGLQAEQLKVYQSQK